VKTEKNTGAIRFRQGLLYLETSVTTPPQTGRHIPVGHHKRNPDIISYKWLDSANGPRPHHCWGSANTLRHIQIGRTPLDEWSARLRDHYLTKHITHKTETAIPPVGLEPAIPASERTQTHAVDSSANGIVI